MRSVGSGTSYYITKIFEFNHSLSFLLNRCSVDILSTNLQRDMTEAELTFCHQKCIFSYSDLFQRDSLIVRHYADTLWCLRVNADGDRLSLILSTS